MNSSTNAKTSSYVARLGWAVLALAATVAVTEAGCTLNEWGGGGEGDRCNPFLSHDECGSGLQCTQPSLCPENYCCPTSGTSSNPFCQTGCNGGAASICAADMDPDACAFAGVTTPGATSEAGGPEPSPEAGE
jgi:hypothetical protein